MEKLKLETKLTLSLHVCSHDCRFLPHNWVHGEVASSHWPSRWHWSWQKWLPHLSFLPQGRPHRTSVNQHGWFFSVRLPQIQGFATRYEHFGQDTVSGWHWCFVWGCWHELGRVQSKWHGGAWLPHGWGGWRTVRPHAQLMSSNTASRQLRQGPLWQRSGSWVSLSYVIVTR